MKLAGKLRRLSLALLFAPMGAALAADAIDLSNVPLFIVSPVKPNLMVILDNSQSMDGTMAGMLVAGDDLNTRGNIARKILRKVIGDNRSKINWGLTSFETQTPALRDTHAYYMGDENTMVFTNDCTTALAANVNRKGCVAIPGTPGGGLGFVTYSQSGDDPAVNDVLYTATNTAPTVMYGPVDFGSNYFIYGSRNATQPWENATFGSPPFGFGSFVLTPTDAGFVPSALSTPSVKRQVWIKRGWGYRGPITGAGDIREPVQADSQPHYDRLVETLLKNEDRNTSSTNAEIKNAALYTPLAGTVETVKNYFAGGSTPITQSCQKNYVVLATDGVPTGQKDGDQYDVSERTNVKQPDGSWVFGQAQRDVFAEIRKLKNNVTLAASSGGISTYVIGMGESTTNESSVAALNQMASDGGTGAAFIGDNEANLADAFNSIVNQVDNLSRGGSAVALNSGSFQTGSALYQAKFKSGDWSGSLYAFPANANGQIATTFSWNTGALLKARTAARNIITYKPSAALGSRGVPFLWPADANAPAATELDTAQTAELSKNPSTSLADANGAARLAYVRGDASNEARNCTGTCAPKFRDRIDGPHGDIINSAPVFVGAPAFGYANDFETGSGASYSAFTTTNKNRTKAVYVGANDGMLHAFDAGTGAELFGYVPAAVYPALNQLSNPTYSHRYYVDGSPTVGDVFYGNAWRTMLVAGMRAGAKGLFALDVTDPSLFTQANAASIVRWEFQDAADMGFVFGQPLLVKTNNGRWSVIVSGGYENTSGKAVLFVIDAQDGTVVRKLTAGATSANNGLSGPAAIDANGDGIADLVYAGDLNGKLWKFDLTSTDPANWAVGNGGLALYDAGASKPITSTPDVTRHPKGGYLIGFGTGRYMADNDNSNTNTQSLYGVWDNLSNDGTVAQSQLQQQSILDKTTNAGVAFRLSSHIVGSPVDTIVVGDGPTLSRNDYFSSKRGWFLNLVEPATTPPTPASGERAAADVAFRSGRMIAVTLIPGKTCADPDGSGWLMEFDAITGNRLDVVTFDISNDGKLTAAVLNNTTGSGDYLTFSLSGAAGNNVSGRRIDGIPSGQTTVGKGDNQEARLISTSKGTLEQITTGRGAGRDGRAMWREVR